MSALGGAEKVYCRGYGMSNDNSEWLNNQLNEDHRIATTEMNGLYSAISRRDEEA